MSNALTSDCGRYTVTLQGDGNLVVYDRGGRVIWASGVDPHPELVPEPAPPPVTPTTDTWPRIGLSYYTSLTDPRVDIPGFAARLRDAGANLTRVWLLDAWAVSADGGTGCYDGYIPWEKPDGSRYDLECVNPWYLDRVRAYVEAMNAVGVLPQLSGLELYTWSSRKAGLLWVPDANRGPLRNNRNGIYYADDTAFTRIAQPSGPDAFLGVLYGRIVSALAGLSYTVELANEMPEKPLHERLKTLWRTAGYLGAISVNRHEDTPGQYNNMRIGANYDRIAYHGRGHIEYLDEVFPREPLYQTFRAFYASGPDPSRIVLSSDGCRKSIDVNDAYDYAALETVFRDARQRGFSIEHQSRMKLRGFTEGRIDLADLEVDWLRQFS